MNYLHQRSWSFLLKNILLPFGDRLIGQQMMKRWAFLSKAQWWDSSRLQQHRDQLLRELIQVAYQEVPIYRQVMDENSLQPTDFRSAEDLRKLPILTKDILRSGFPSQTTRRTGQKTYVACTSGSTGQNFCVLEDADTAGWYRASLMLVFEWVGWQLGNPHMQTGITLNRGLDRRLKDWLLKCFYVPSYNLSDDVLLTSLQLLEQKNIRHLWGYPVSLYLLAQKALQNGWNLPMKSLITWGDNLYPHYRQTIEKVFQTKITDTYGCCEGFHVSAQCGIGSNYHIHMLDVIVEFLDDQGSPVPPGQPGHIIVTRLHPGPMPLIRYRVGDIGVPASGNCSCGRGFEIMLGIQGRDTDIIFTPSGNHLIVHFFTGILEHFSEVDSFQVVQEIKDSIKLYIKPRNGFTPQTQKKILNLFRERGAGDLDVEFIVVEDIPLTSAGKRRFIINKIINPSVKFHGTIK